MLPTRRGSLLTASTVIHPEDAAVPSALPGDVARRSGQPRGERPNGSCGDSHFKRSFVGQFRVFPLSRTGPLVCNRQVSPPQYHAPASPCCSRGWERRTVHRVQPQTGQHGLHTSTTVTLHHDVSATTAAKFAAALEELIRQVWSTAEVSVWIRRKSSGEVS